MSGNTFGKIFQVSTFGESHGVALGAMVDGCPAGLALSVEDIQKDLDRRRPGQSKFTTQRQESDRVQIVAGIFEGKTTGAPIGLLIWNEDQKSKDYADIKDLFRPGHADFTYHHKYGIRDYRGGGRSSARETAVRVAAGAIARQYLQQYYQIQILAAVTQIGTINLPIVDLSVIDQNPFFITDLSKVTLLEEYIHSIRKEGDSVGAKVTVIAKNVPLGLGEPVFDRLDADLAKAMMSINAVKAVAVGDGFEVTHQKGSEHRDELNGTGFLTNHAGGILGGISTGQDIILELAFKPTSSILKPGRTLDIYGNEVEVVTKGRHDPCVGIRGAPVAEAMCALVLMDHLLRYRAYGGCAIVKI